MDDASAAIVREAERIIYQAGWRVQEEVALQQLAGTIGLRWTPLDPRSDVIQLVTFNGEHLGRRSPSRGAARPPGLADGRRAPSPARGRRSHEHHDGGTMQVEMIIEVPQGSRNKYEMDAATGRIRLDRMLFTSTRYPLDYGFIPGTLGEDGDPLDAMILLGEPAFPGTFVAARPIAVFWMHDEHGPDAKILTVPVSDPRYQEVQDLPDVPPYLLAEISHFFDVYKELEPGKSSDVRGWQDKEAAEREIGAAFERGRDNPAAGLAPGRI
jgi:inorganic pyrophosphatase